MIARSQPTRRLSSRFPAGQLLRLPLTQAGSQSVVLWNDQSTRGQRDNSEN